VIAPISADNVRFWRQLAPKSDIVSRVDCDDSGRHMDSQPPLFGFDDMPTARPPTADQARRAEAAHREQAPSIAGSDTSQAAAEQIEHHVTKLQAAALVHLRYFRHIGATDYEIQQALKMAQSTERPRRIELVAKGLVTEAKDNAGRKITRPTDTGRQAQVWVASAAQSTADLAAPRRELQGASRPHDRPA